MQFLFTDYRKRLDTTRVWLSYIDDGQLCLWTQIRIMHTKFDKRIHLKADTKLAVVIRPCKEMMIFEQCTDTTIEQRKFRPYRFQIVIGERGVSIRNYNVSVINRFSFKLTHTYLAASYCTTITAHPGRGRIYVQFSVLTTEQTWSTTVIPQPRKSKFRQKQEKHSHKWHRQMFSASHSPRPIKMDVPCL